MKLIKNEKTFKNEKNETVSFYQVYLVAEVNGTEFVIPIKAIFKNDNKILTALAIKED